MAKYRFLAVAPAVLLIIALTAPSARATSTSVPDPQIFIQQSGTTPAGGDPNIITNTGAFVIGVAGSFTLQDPLLVIIGVYDSATQPELSSTTGCTNPLNCPLAAVTTYGLTADSATFTSGVAYDQLGLAAGGSENFVNWTNADLGAGLAAPSFFTLYAFEIDASLVHGSPFTIDTNAPIGSFIIGYDCELKKGKPTGSDSGCATSGDIGQTPFTNAGFINTGPINKVPEPAGLALLGSGLVLIGSLLRRKIRGNA